ncbi:MAG: hypothetical protein E2O89_07585, partial [Alphaproteobacteria bacterium]
QFCVDALEEAMGRYGPPEIFNTDQGSQFTSWSWIVRRHINWNNPGSDLKEDLAHLVQDIKRRICGIASAGFPSFSV